MENKHTIYFNMCNHYRKLYNAKACVDTSPPKTLKFKSTLSISNLSLNKIRKCRTVTSERKLQPPTQKYQKFQNQNSEGTKCMNAFIEAGPFQPRILKTEAQSKLRSMSVYNPPKRRKVASSLSLQANSNTPSAKLTVADSDVITQSSQNHDLKKSSVTIVDVNSGSEYSVDSAYNEGEYGLSGESRGSTPYKMNTVVRELKSPAAHLNKSSSSEKNAKSDEVTYIKFLKEITDDILKKGIYTNRGLKHVFQYHIRRYKKKLDQKIMLLEIEKLQERLGIPQDDELDDLGFGLGDITYELVTLNSENNVKDDYNQRSLSSENRNYDDRSQKNSTVVESNNKKSLGDTQKRSVQLDNDEESMITGTIGEIPESSGEIKDDRYNNNNNYDDQNNTGEQYSEKSDLYGDDEGDNIVTDGESYHETLNTDEEVEEIESADGTSNDESTSSIAEINEISSELSSIIEG